MSRDKHQPRDQHPKENRTTKQLLAELTAKVEAQQASLDNVAAFVTELEEYFEVLKRTP